MATMTLCKLEQVNKYISEFKDGVNGKYRLRYHMMPPLGWMNDPNGLVFYKGNYHLYYQFNPYDTCAGTMFWGHIVSEDTVAYGDAGAAIAPEEEFTSIFSGGAIETDGLLNVLYTLHYENGGVKTEKVYAASSVNGYGFTNGKCVFDNGLLPENISRADFRDPCPAKIGDKFYVFVGGKDTGLNAGIIVVLGGKTLDRLDYEFTIGPFYELGDMGECPSYFRVDGKDVIVVSGCNVEARGNDFKNVNSSVFIVGEIDFEKGAMQVDFIKEIDKGDTFYAPQFISGLKQPVMIGWFEMWFKKYPTRELGHGWTGAFSIPRRLHYKDGDIFQEPIAALENYCSVVDNGCLPKCADLSFCFDGEGAVTISGENGSVVIRNNGYIYLDTRLGNNLNGCVRRTNGTYRACDVRVLLDVSGIEVFIDGGREAISSRIYIDGDYTLKTEGQVNSVVIKRIGGKQ